MVGNSFSYVFRADGVLGAVIAGAGMVVVGGTVLAVAGAAALVGILTKKKWGDDATQDISQFYHSTKIIPVTLTAPWFVFFKCNWWLIWNVSSRNAPVNVKIR